MLVHATIFKPFTKAQDNIHSSSFSSTSMLTLPENADDRKKIREGKGWTDGDRLKGREVEKRKQNTLIDIENKKSINTIDEI